MSANERTFTVLHGHPERRQWADARRYGFVSAGGMLGWRRPWQRLQAIYLVGVLMPGKRYVGSAAVAAEMRPSGQAESEVDGTPTPLRSLPLDLPHFRWSTGELDLAEYIVPVQWNGMVAEPDAYWRKDLLYPRMLVWPFDDLCQAAEIRDSLKSRDNIAPDHMHGRMRGRE